MMIKSISLRTTSTLATPSIPFGKMPPKPSAKEAANALRERLSEANITPPPMITGVELPKQGSFILIGVQNLADKEYYTNALRKLGLIENKTTGKLYFQGFPIDIKDGISIIQ